MPSACMVCVFSKPWIALVPLKGHVGLLLACTKSSHSPPGRLKREQDPKMGQLAEEMAQLRELLH